jgi:hypothetical protein
LTTDRRSLPLCQEINGSLRKPRIEERGVHRRISRPTRNLTLLSGRCADSCYVFKVRGAKS